MPSSLQRILTCVLLCLGTVLVIYSVNTIASLWSAYTGLFSAAADKTVWLLIAGVLMIGAGVGGFVHQARVR